MFYYILGACIAGLSFLLLTFINSFYDFLNNNIDEAKKELKNDEKYGIIETTFVDNINNDSVISSLNTIIALLSWLGVLLVLYYIITYLINKK